MTEKQISQFIPVQEGFIPTIKIIGVGGAGGNVVTQMAEESFDQVETIVCNTDAKALKRNKANKKIELGKKLTRGMGAGARPEVGESAAEESMKEIGETIEGADMVFLAAGMGGGTGTGAAPAIARLAMEKQNHTLGIVTIPFTFEGSKRRRSAIAGVERLREFTDTLLVIPNDKLLDASTQNTSFLEAFHMVDMVLINAIRGITMLLSGVGDINVDFADVQTIMKGMGKAVIGRGVAKGKDRALNAVEDALHGSLMEDTDIRGAKGILVQVSGPKDTSAYEIQEAMALIEDMADEDVELIWGATFSKTEKDELTMTVIATGLP